MKAIFRVFSFLVCAVLVIFWSAHPPAQPFGQTLGVLAAPGANAAAQAGTFTTFDFPGSTSTVPVGINPAGAITGYYQGAGGRTHGFLRAPDGTFTKFDVPGSICTPALPVCTQPSGINPAGAITGFYQDANFVSHGFLRAPDGTFTIFDAPGVRCRSLSPCTLPSGINPAGAITGHFIDANGFHGFLRAPDGTITKFDHPGSKATQPTGINPAGAVTGYFQGAGGRTHGFLRAPDGTFTKFDVLPSASCDPHFSVCTQPSGINSAGAITGTYQAANFVSRGFLRAPDGTITKFDVPGSRGTRPAGINREGAIAGSYEGAGATHGFLRAPDGTFTKFDVPGSICTPAFSICAFPVGINPAGAITGYYQAQGAKFLIHGFLRSP